MEYKDLMCSYPLPDKTVEYHTIPELLSIYGNKVMKIRRHSWAYSYAILDSVWFPRPGSPYCAAWANSFYHGGSVRREQLPYANKPFWALIQLSDIDLIVNYKEEVRESEEEPEHSISCP